MSKRITTILNNVADVIDSLHQTPKYSETGYPMVRVTDIKGGYLKTDGCLLVNKEVFKDFSRNHKSSLGDIVISRVGSYGITSYVNEELEFCLGQNTAFICPNKIDGKYLFYYLNSTKGRQEIEGFVTGSTQKTISLQSIKSIEIEAPSSIEDQQQIASILSSLDDKIQLNLQMNQTLEAMAQAIFKEWFGDFNFPGFDGELVDGLPKGWRMGSVLDISSLLSGGTPKTDIQNYWNGDIGWISAKDITANNGRFILDTEKKITKLGIERSAAKILPTFTTVVSARGTVGNYCILSKEMSISQSNYGLKSNSEKDFFLFVLIENMIEMMQAYSYGTVFDTITTKTFQEMEIIIPDDNTAEHYETTVKPIFEKILDNQRNIQTLTQIRDSLLPKLMTGKIQVTI